ncbi:helix-turn-helix transcriptional regulator [Pleionea sediminis]|uniref:helix-turn-helix transcriptional regulator n=1 Tax=Pleionea sediminis TaxID=2569479 RepID=UPI001185BD9B|nr:helix-turn-helix transcriptional regulator [Pleionea sediminis]
MNINSELLKKERLKRGWTQQHLADIVGLSSRTIQRIESKGVTSMDTASALCAVLEISREDLLEGEKEIKEVKFNIPMLMFLLFIAGLLLGVFTTIVFILSFYNLS